MHLGRIHISINLFLSILVFSFISVSFNSNAEDGSSNYKPILPSNYAPQPFNPGGNLNLNVNQCGAMNFQPPPAEGEVSEELSCSTPATDRTLINKIISQNNQVQAIATQKLNYLQQIEQQISCLKKQMNALELQISQLAQAYTQNIQKFKKEFQNMEELQKTRKEQLLDVQERLLGGKRGELGLQQIEKDFDQLVNSMPDQINNFTNLITTQENSQKSFDEGILAEQASRMKKCFNEEKRTNLTCGNKGENVSAKENLLCAYEFAYHTSSKNRSKADEELAAREKDRLSTLIDQMLGDLPEGSAFEGGTGAPGQGLQINVPNYSIKNPDDIKKKYGSLLNQASFYQQSKTGKPRKSSVNVFAAVFSNMQYCYTKAQRSVKSDRNKKSSSIGKAQEQLKEMTRNIDTLMTKALDNYSNVWSKANRSLTGMHIPLDTNACKTTAPREKLSCISKFNTVFDGLLKGTTSGSQMTIMIKGNPVTINGAQTPTFIQGTCKGIHGCVTYYQALGRDLEKEINNIETAKARYVTDANNSVQNFTSQVAQALKPQALALTDRVGQINMMLAQLGVEDGLDANEMKAIDFQYDKNGLVDVPKDLKALIGGQAGMLNLDAKAFASGTKGIAKGRKDIQKKIGEAAKANDKLEIKFNECVKEEKKEQADKEEKARERELLLAAAGVDSTGDVAHNDHCSSVINYCKSGEDGVDAILNYFAVASGNASLGNTDSLYTGIEDLCDEVNDGLGENRALRECRSLFEDAQEQGRIRDSSNGSSSGRATGAN